MSFRIRAKLRFDFGKVQRVANKSAITSLGHAGGAVMRAAKNLIRRSPKASSEGTPPHTRKGLLKRAIQYAVEPSKKSVVIGPDVNYIGDSGKAHEFGGFFRREKYPKRAFMGPALEKVKDRLPSFWRNSVHE